MPCNSDLFGFRAASRARRLHDTAVAFAEPLEPRIFLSDTPFPDIAALSDPNNVVVRVETSLGDVDFELYNASSPGGSAAPNTVTNFLNYIRRGDFDLSFFHRLAFNDAARTDPFVLQGGGFRFDDDLGLREVPLDDPILNEFDTDRSNLERTIAMAKRPGDPDSATSQWFINLGDNQFLDSQNGGFTVFGRVLDDRSWNVVQQMAMLDVFVFADVVVDEDGEVIQGPFGPTPLTGANPLSFALTDVPVVTSPDPIAPGTLRSPALEERFLLILEDVEIIKPADVGAFFTQRVAYPEGFRSPNTATTIELSNLDPNNVAEYQVIVRYENGDRDTVVGFGSINANGHATVEIADFGMMLNDVVREFVPYAIEVQSTQLVAASLNHTDYGATLGESFVNVTDPAAYGTGALRDWSFGGVDSVAEVSGVTDRFPYLVWQNLSLTPATVTVTITRPGSGDQVITMPLEGLRRGGLELFNIAGYSNGIEAIRVTADQDIVAALSVYDTRDDGSGATSHAYGVGGMAGGPASIGGLAGARVGDGEAYISIHNPNKTRIVVIDFSFINSEGDIQASTRVVNANQRSAINLQNLVDSGFVAADESFTVRYSARISVPAGPADVAVQYVSVSDGETVAAPFQTHTAQGMVFSGGGFVPGAGLSEIISIHNIFDAAAGSGGQLIVNVRFLFKDQAVIGSVGEGTFFLLDAGDRMDIDVASLTSVGSVIARGEEYQHYTIAITAITASGQGGAIATVGRYDASGAASVAYAPTLINFPDMGVTDPFTPLDDPIFEGGTPG
ncbi:MAG: peptidylprolyl isomerase [Phycisphaerales bacterium JB039]